MFDLLGIATAALLALVFVADLYIIVWIIGRAWRHGRGYAHLEVTDTSSHKTYNINGGEWSIGKNKKGRRTPEKIVKDASRMKIN